ncbi:MAG TPA: hypothetical protein VN203_14340, partial [Candidatus Acidoferrum sp.]|nr:hypothetical protein [Candidatus Acidoferrum sp.]
FLPEKLAAAKAAMTRGSNDVADYPNPDLAIERMGDHGRYLAVEASPFLKIRADQVTPWLIDEDSSDETAWARRLRAWVRAELLPRGA